MPFSLKVYLPFFYLSALIGGSLQDVQDEPDEGNFSIGFTEIGNFGVHIPSFTMSSWKNESLLIPIVIKKVGEGTEKVNLTVSYSEPLSHKIAKLEYVLGDLSAGACGVNKSGGTFEEAYFPDRVNYLTNMSIDLGHELTYLLAKIFIPQETEKGKHTVSFKIESPEGIREISAEITVIDQVLQEEKDPDFKLNFWQFPLSVSSYYQIKPWSAKHMAYLEENFIQLNNIRQRSITTSVFWDLYNGKLRAPEDLMIRCIKKEDGGWAYDYSNFEKYVELGISCGIDEQIDVHNLFPWNLSYFYVEENTGNIQSFKAGPLTEAYKEFWTPFLKNFSAYLEEKEWKDQVVFFIDERNKDQSIALANFIKGMDPQFRVGYAGRFYPDLSEVIDNYSLPSNISLNQKELEKRKEANKITTFYTACWEKQPNMLMMSNYLDFYFLLMLSKARGYDGFLRWAFNSWGGNIMTDARYTDVPSGDAHFIYPYNQPSIRYELIQDALEEVRKVSLLNKDKEVNELLNRYTDNSLLGNQKIRNELVDSMMRRVNQ